MVLGLIDIARGYVRRREIKKIISALKQEAHELEFDFDVSPWEKKESLRRLRRMIARLESKIQVK